jgi:hypothetical protein
MRVTELRDGDDARTWARQGLWLCRLAPVIPATVRPTLEWALAIAAAGDPLPPLGFVADLGQLLLGSPGRRPPLVELPGWPPALGQSYEDHLLGRLFADAAVERAADAVQRYQGKDRATGLAFAVRRLRERADLGGVELSPAILRGLAADPPEQVLAAGYESLATDGPVPLLVDQYEQLAAAARRMAEPLGAEDVVALEQRTALADLGQYVAHRQILQVAARLEAALPARPVRPAVGRKEVPTRVPDEDQYPVGGYASIATKGSVESLLHSQLAYMEPDQGPDLFDVKFVRDELFYYSRDDNRFLRRRRAFAVVFRPDLTAARFKDADQPAQRIVLTLAAILATVRRLADWLSTDALRFELLFEAAGGVTPLEHERDLTATLLRELVGRGVAEVAPLDAAGIRRRLDALSHQSQLCVCEASVGGQREDIDGAVVCGLAVGAVPKLTAGHGRPVPLDADGGLDAWAAAVRGLLELWV